MPYDELSDLPDAVQKMPKHAQEIYQSAFNSAFKQYDGNEGRAHGTAWSAVEKQYKKENGRWVAKSKEATMKVKEAGLSDENKRQLLQAGLTTEYGLDVDNTIPRGVWVEDVFENEVIYNVNGQSFKASYKMKDGKATFGEPEKVLRQTVYKAMESLQTTYSELIQEAGKRNALMDAARVKKIVELAVGGSYLALYIDQGFLWDISLLPGKAAGTESCCCPPQLCLGNLFV
ncbi:unnamed protein product [marine sediment metagenome]|uniref:Cation transport regulator ChaB n=1 Tax=marine sediment metagenome TaxID=412755 RepID=X1AMD1_9ZZZZ